MIESTISTQKMQMLQPEMERIQNKYRGKNDRTSQMRMQNEIMNLYKKNNVSMFGSLWTFLTLPIMFRNVWCCSENPDLVYITGIWYEFRFNTFISDY